MRIAACILSALIPVATAQTTGVPGVNDFTLNGLGGGGTSPVPLAVPLGPFSAMLGVDTVPGSFVVVATGTAAPGTVDLNGMGLHHRDLDPVSIWLDPLVYPGLLTVPASGAWQLTCPVTVTSGLSVPLQVGLLGPTFPGGIASTQLLVAAGASPLPSCTLDFEPSSGPCPTTPGNPCGVLFTGGDGCVIDGLPFCYSSGGFGYRVSAGSPLSIDATGDLLSLRTFFAHTPGTSGAMRFFNAVGGVEVAAPLSSNGDCTVMMPALLTRSFPAAVRRITVTVTGPGAVYLDDFRVNPL